MTMTRNLISAAAAGAALALALGAGTATAGTYQGTASYSETSDVLSVEWSGVSPACDRDALTAAVPAHGSAVIDGNTYSITLLSSDLDISSGFRWALFTDAASGHLSSIILGGKSFIQCGGDTLLLPGHTTPAPIPTLSEWAMILLGVAMAGGAALMIQRRRVAR